MDQIDTHGEANNAERSVTYERCLSTYKPKDIGTKVYGSNKEGVNTHRGRFRKRTGSFKGVPDKTTLSDVAYQITLMLLLTGILSCDAEAVGKNLSSVTAQPWKPRSSIQNQQLNDSEVQCETGKERRRVLKVIDTCISQMKNHICLLGVMRSSSQIQNTSTYLTIIEEKCPAGFYQPTNSYCFIACKHGNTSNMPKALVIYSIEDEKSPTLVFCNHLEGYYNVNGSLFIDYHECDHNYTFCRQTSIGNQCTKDKQLLPDGTCVSPCEEGSDRDVSSNFTCKKSLSTEPQPTTTTVTPAATDHPETTTNTKSPDDNITAINNTLTRLMLSLVNGNDPNEPQTTTTTVTPTATTHTETTTNRTIQETTNSDGEAVNTVTTVNMLIVTVIIVDVTVFLGILSVVVAILFVCRRLKKLKERKEGGPVGNTETPQSNEVSASETASNISSNESSRASPGVTATYTEKTETNVFNPCKINVGNSKSVQFHLHYNTSSSSVGNRTINNKTQTAVNDDEGGLTLTQHSTEDHEIDQQNRVNMTTEHFSLYVETETQWKWKPKGALNNAWNSRTVDTQ